MSEEYPLYPRWVWRRGEACTLMDGIKIRVTSELADDDEWVYHVWKQTGDEWVEQMQMQIPVGEDDLANLRRRWEELATMLPEMIMEHLL